MKYKLEAEDPELITGQNLELLGKNIYQAEQKLKRLEAAVKLLFKDHQRNETIREHIAVITRWNDACGAVSRGVPIGEACRGESETSWLRKRAAHTSATTKGELPDSKSCPTEKKSGSKAPDPPDDDDDDDEWSDCEEDEKDEDREDEVKAAFAAQAADWKKATQHGVCYEIRVKFEVPMWDCALIPPFVWTMIGWGPMQKLIEVKEIYTNSFTITASTASTALLDDYIGRWKALAPHEANYPYPVRGMTKEVIRQFARITLSRATLSRLWPDQKIKLMVKAFLVGGKGIGATFTEDRSKIEVKLARSTTDAQMSAFKKYLKHKELPRWHSDWINKRTGDANSAQPDESIGGREEVKLIRTAIDEMVEMCETWKKEVHRF